MRVSYILMAVASVAFLVFSWFMVVELVNTSTEDFDHFSQVRADIHWWVKLVSIPCFLAAAGTCLFGFMAAKGRVVWRAILAIVVAGSVVMSLWAVVLSGGISFDEVVLAWLISGAVYLAVGISGACLKISATHSEPA